MNRACGDATDLLGRAAELERLRRSVAGGGSCIVRGRAGVGKTALLRAAVGNDAVVVRGLAALRTVPYVPLRSAWSTLDVRDSAAGIVRDLDVRLPAGSPLIVDDLHWCDPDSLAVFAELAMRRPLIGCVRPGATPADALVDVVAATGELLDIGPLDVDEARQLVRRLRPGAPAPDVERWVRSASGMPLELELFALDAGPGGDVAGAARRAVAALSHADRLTLGRVALAGEPLELDERRVAALRSAGLVEVSDGCRCSMRHDLLADAAIAALSPAERAAAHRDLAAAAEEPAGRARHLDETDAHADAVAAGREAAASAPTVWSRAEALAIVARHCRPPDPDASALAAEALSRAGRYREAIDVLDSIGGGPSPLVRARSHWAISEIEAAREAIASGLAGDVGIAERVELLSLDSRIRTRVDWDLEGGIAVAQEAVAAAVGAERVSAQSALGLAYLMAGDPRWIDALELAGDLVVAGDDVHNAVTVFDTMVFGHLLSGDPRRCRPLTSSMIELTESTSAAWNGYFRAAALLFALHVDAEHREVLAEVGPLLGRRLSPKTREMVGPVQALALADGGRELDAIDVALAAVELADDDTALSMSLWALAEVSWLSGEAERAIEHSERAVALAVPGYPGLVNAALIGEWARRDLGLPSDPTAVAATRSAFPNLAGTALEADALAAGVADGFLEAAQRWRGVSRRSELRCLWAAAETAADAGDEGSAVRLLASAESGAVERDIVWLLRRTDALRRRLGVGARAGRAGRAGALVLERVARGQTSAQIGRGLVISPTTVETHVRRAIVREGARNRLHAAALAATATSEPVGTIEVRRGQPIEVRSSAAEIDGADALSSLANVPWSLVGRTVTGPIDDEDGVARAVLAVTRGADLVARLTDDALLADLLDGLSRSGARIVDHPAEPAVDIDALDARIIDLLASGSSIAEAARELGYSRRTLERRLAALRSTLGARTNQQAVAEGLRLRR